MKVIKVGAVWCNGCNVMRPRWKKIESENTWLVTKYLDFDIDSKEITKYKIEGQNLPCFIFLDKNSKELLRLNGEVSEEDLLKHINNFKDK